MKNNAAAFLSLFVILFSPFSGALAQEVASEGNSSISGKVVRADGKPATNVQVLAYHLSTENSYASKPTTGSGEYNLGGLPYGYFDLAVETADCLYVANQVVNLPPAGKTGVSFTLSSELCSEGEAREFPGSDNPSTGQAQIRERLKGREFWRSPKGVAILSSVGGVALLAIASGGGSSGGGSVASPTTP